jgi:hypothetical protein
MQSEYVIEKENFSVAIGDKGDSVFYLWLTLER